ncbi:MAG: membrane protease [Oscillospiraceae bacterium]|nr:membrane protease [Oscillospiraceae bacterium]
MKRIIALVLAVVIAVCCIACLERVSVGNVGVVYSTKGVESETLAPGWHWVSPVKRIKQFPVSQQQIVFSNDPADYNENKHDDWSIDAPASGGMVKINLTVNYSFQADKVVELYSRFNGMDGEQLVSNYIQNSIIAYVKEVTPKFSVMDIYSEKKSEVNQAISEYLNEKLSSVYGINVHSALIIDVELDETLRQKVLAKEQAKQDAEIAELERQTSLAQAQTSLAMAEAQAEIDRTEAQTAADVAIIEAQAEAEANRVIAESITPELIQMIEAQARLEHGWVTVQGTDSVVVSGK